MTGHVRQEHRYNASSGRESGHLVFVRDDKVFMCGDMWVNDHGQLGLALWVGKPPLYESMMMYNPTIADYHFWRNTLIE